MKPVATKVLTTVLAAAASAALLAGCGGGGSSATTPLSTPAGNAPQVPMGTLVLTFPVGSRTSSANRAPRYVSPNSTKIEVKVNSGAPSGFAYDATTNLDFTAGTGNCTLSGGTATCTIAVPTPPGNINYTFNAEDGSNNVLATVTKSFTITAGTKPSLSAVLQGVVKTVTISAASLTANDTSHASSGETVTVSALDASGATIVNGATSANYANPITLTDNDGTGQTKLSVNGGTAASSVQVNNPSDVVTLTYTGQAADPFTITASGTGISGTGNIGTTVFDVTFAGVSGANFSLDDAGHGGLSSDANWSEPTLFFLQPSGSQSVSGSETGWTNAPFSKQFDLDFGPNASPWCRFYGDNTTNTIVRFTSLGPATTFAATAQGASGVCKVRLKEHGTGYPITTHPAPSSSTDTTHDGTFWVSVTTSNVTVNGKGRQVH